MRVTRYLLQATKAAAAVSLCCASTAAVASTAIRPAIKPLAAPAVSTTLLASAAANPCVAGVQGCVLPLPEPPPPLAEAAPPPVVEEAAPKGLGLLPLAGLALAGLLALLLLDDDDDGDEQGGGGPVSPGS